MESYEARLKRIEREVLDELYDAVFDPAAWGRMVNLIGDAFGEFHPILWVESWDKHRISAMSFAGWDPDLMQVAVRDYADKNCFEPALDAASTGKVTMTADHVPADVVLKSAFYADILKKQDDIRLASGFFAAKNDVQFAALGFHYPHRYAEALVPAGMHLMARLRPHVVRAFTLGLRALEHHEAMAVEALALPTLALNADGRLVRANAPAIALLERGNALSLAVDGTLILARDAKANVSPADMARHTVLSRSPYAMSLRLKGGGRGAIHFVPIRPEAHPVDPVYAFTAGRQAGTLAYVTL